MPYDIVHELRIEAAPQLVFDAVTTPEGVAGWWTTDCELIPEAGSRARFGFDGHSLTMEIDLLEAPELVHWRCVEGPDEWVGTTLAFRIEADGDGSRVRFWHGGWEYEDGLLPSSSFEWAMDLDRLRRAVESA